LSVFNAFHRRFSQQSVRSGRTENKNGKTKREIIAKNRDLIGLKNKDWQGAKDNIINKFKRTPKAENAVCVSVCICSMQ